MTKQHLKTLAMPKTWPIPRKHSTFVTRPLPSGTEKELSMSLNMALRDVIKIAETAKEVKRILNSSEVLVNASRRKDIKLPISFLDTLSIPEIKEYYRISLDKKGKFKPVTISSEEAVTKPCKIMNKHIIGKDKVQINFTDGRNMLVKDSEKYSTGDTLVINLKDNKILRHIPLEKGREVFLFKGIHTGKRMIIDNIKEGEVFFKSENKKTIHTKKDYVIAIDKEVTC